MIQGGKISKAIFEAIINIAATQKHIKLKTSITFGSSIPRSWCCSLISYFLHDLFNCSLTNALEGHMTWNPTWPSPNRANIKTSIVGIIEPRKVILVPHPMFLSTIYSRIHIEMHSKVTWPKYNMIAIESPRKPSCINLCSSQRVWGTNQTKAKCDGCGNQICCNNNKAVTRSMFLFCLTRCFLPSNHHTLFKWMEPNCCGFCLVYWTRIAHLDQSGFMQVVHVCQHNGVASFLYLPIIDMDPTDLNCIH